MRQWWHVLCTQKKSPLRSSSAFHAGVPLHPKSAASGLSASTELFVCQRIIHEGNSHVGRCAAATAQEEFCHCFKMTPQKPLQVS